MSVSETEPARSQEASPDLDDPRPAELEGCSWAVVVFAQRDAGWCDWLHANFDGYPVPGSLVDQTPPEGLARPDALSIFPDRTDVGYEIRVPRALETSAWLVLICSPLSVNHPGIHEQVRAFKAAGGEERIVALVVDGSPTAHLGGQRPEESDSWLPDWLRRRLEDSDAVEVDRQQPWIVDARVGRQKLQKVRDTLLAILMESDLEELDRLGALARPVRLARLAEEPPSTVALDPVTTIDQATTLRPAASMKYDTTFMVGLATVLIVLAAIFGIKSFRELGADEPPSRLAFESRVPRTLSTVNGEARLQTAGHLASVEVAAPTEVVEPVPPSPVLQAPANQESLVGPEKSEPVVAVTPPPLTPPRAFATTHLETQGFTTSRVGAPVAITATTPAVPAPAAPTEDAVLLDEVTTLERRGDETVAERRVEDALDLYGAALDSAVDYASRKNVPPAAKDHVVMLLRKLGALQAQHSSTAEARSTYQQARKTLLQMKSQGAWNRDRAKTLDEMETRLLSLPRD